MINNLRPQVVKYDDVIERIDKPMSDSDLERYLGSPASDYIVKYSDLDNYKKIEELLPKEKDFKIILTESSLNNGHWTALMRYKDTIEAFNSYGSKPSYELGFISKIKNAFLGQDERHLNKLLNRALKEKKYKIIYNKKKFQKYSPSIQTCGRHCVLRILLLNQDYTLEDYINWMEKQLKSFGWSLELRELPRKYWSDFVAAYYIA